MTPPPPPLPPCALAPQVSKRLGRIETTLANKAVGVSLLVAIASLGDGAYRSIIGLYLLRTWVMNCTSGLTKSVLNDYVPKARVI